MEGQKEKEAGAYVNFDILSEGVHGQSGGRVTMILFMLRIGTDLDATAGKQRERAN